MGSRADFYDLRDGALQWLGSIAWGGYPSGIPSVIAASGSRRGYLKGIESLHGRDDWTHPSNGWPWPWETSATTDCAYVFHEGEVLVSSFGSEWYPMAGALRDQGYESDPADAVHGLPEFPDMSAVQKVTMGRRSGLLVFGV